MKFQSLVIVAFSIFNLLNIKAQNHELGKVTIAELEQKKHPIDSSAVAAILFSKGLVKLTASGYSDVNFQTRIKIYKKEGYDWANVQISFPAGKLSELRIKDVYTYNLIDGKIVKSKLFQEGEFIEKNNKRYWVRKIIFPDVREGSIIEYQYNKDGGFLNIQDWDFQKDIPVNYSELKTIIPNSFSFKRNLKGYFIPKTTTEIVNKNGSLASESTYVFQDLPAMKEETFVNNINNYRSAISHEIESISIPGQAFKSFSGNWEDVVKTIYKFENFGPELNKTDYFEDDLKLLLQGKIKSDEKIVAILDYVKTNIKWNNHGSYGCDKGVQKAYKEKTGNCADINLMLTTMLRYAGLNANPVLISTRSNGISFFPNTDAFNYVIVAVETSNGNILLDATDEFSTMNILPLRDLNWIGRLVRKDGTSEIIDLMPKKISSDIVSMSYRIDNTGNVEGKIRRQYSEYKALNFRNNIDKKKETVYLEKIGNDNNEIEFTDYKRTNEKELSLPILETFSFTGSNFSEKIGEKVYINPMLFFTNEKNPFKQEKREYPVDFGFPFLEKYTITIKIPENFTVENLPESVSIVMEDNLGFFKYEAAISGDKIQLGIQHQINEAIIGADKYQMLKEYYKALIAKETEKIVLKRI